GVDHPQVPRLGRALARSGFAALLYWSPAMRDFRLDAQDVANIALAYDWLVRQPYVDAARSGLLGTCVGGSFAILAAAHPLIRDRVAFVSEWAAYSSMWTLLRDIASSSRSRGNEREPWQVDPLTRKVYVNSLTEGLVPDERELLRAGDPAQVALCLLSADGRAIQHLLEPRTEDEAEVALRRLPKAIRDRLDALSPLACLGDVKAPLFVFFHDLDDPVIPIEESRGLSAALSGRAGVRYTEFSV